MTKETREKWEGRVQAWRESGLTAEAFTVGKGFAATSLRTAAVELERGVPSRGRSGRATPKPPPPRFLPVVVAGTNPTAVPVSGAELVVEVGAVRIRIARGADLGLVGDLIRELQRGSR